MSRRRPKQNKDNFLSLLARAHYSVGLIAGVLLFAVIRFGLPWSAGWVGQTMASSFNSQATTAQFPDGALTALNFLALAAMLACWMAAAVAWNAGRARRRLLDTQTGLDSLRAMSWQDFERLVAEAFRRQGYQVQETGGGGADGGIDLLLRRRGKTTMVQCKQWRSTRISAPIVREMWGLVAHHGYEGVKIVSVGDFTPDAREFAKGKPMELINGRDLVEMIRSVQSGALAKSATVHDLKTHHKRADGTPKHECPRCSSPMKVRQPKDGGDRFLGCSRFPQCRGTRPLKG